MSEESTEKRITDIEIGLAVVRHDVNNMRMMMTGIENAVRELKGTVFRVGMSIIGSIILMLLGIIGYFIVQKDAQLTAQHTTIMQAERSINAPTRNEPFQEGHNFNSSLHP